MSQQETKIVDNTNLTTQQQLYFQREYEKLARNPTTALILTAVLGGVGAHRFYLREWGWGIAYVLFFWTYIPSIISIIECAQIRSRTTKYNERCAEEILTKMKVTFPEPDVVAGMTA